MPSPKKNETEKDYVSRCIPIVLDEGTAKDSAQAAAICHSMFGEAKKADEEGVFLTNDDLVRRAKSQLARMKVAKVGYYGGRGGDLPDRHLSSGVFIGGFEGCVEHMIQCEGYEESYAEGICSYLKPEGGSGLPKGPEQPEFGTTRPSMFSNKSFDEIGDVKDAEETQAEKNTKAMLVAKYGDFGGNFDECVTEMMDEGYSEDRAEQMCEDIVGKDNQGSRRKGARLETPKLTEPMTRSETESGVLAGRYPEPERVEMPPRVGGMPDELASITIPDSLKPRERFVASRDEQIPKAADKKTGPPGVEDVKLPDNLRARPYGEVPNDIELKQP